MAKVSLVKVDIGEVCRVVEIQGGYGMVRKLNVLGIREGKEVKKLSSQLMRGPLVLEVGSSQVAIGFGMARRIIVEVENR